MTKQHHVTHRSDDEKWIGKANGASRASVVADTKEEAVARTRGISRNQNTELVIHNKDGRISRSDSHGNDPCPPKDQK